MFFHLLTFLSTVLLLSLPCYSQKDPAWDDTRAKNWPPQAQKTLILSSLDRKEQPVYFYKAPGNAPKPLIVSLHTWSGDYQQKDTLVHFCIERGYHYIHPDFRGANQHPDALGSDLVVSDIDDAISYMLNNANVDLQNIHVIGVSGGGHATAVTYMKSKHDIRSFSAYVGIYDLVNWHQESTGRGNKYAGDIAAATTGNRKLFDAKEAKRRSPFYMETPVAKRKNSSLHLYVGIHDGYTGSVPVSQTLEFYNKVVGDFQHEASASLIPQVFIYSMVKNRSLPGIHISESFLDRKIIYQNQYRNTVRVTVFEGAHEMPAG
jgi:acetyl esterase/lipase